MKINDAPLDYVSEVKILAFGFKIILGGTKTSLRSLKKANRQLYMLRMLKKKFGFNHQELITVYKGYVSLLIEYCDSTWHSSLPIGQSKSPEQLQRACRIILGRNFTSFSDALSDRREDHCLRFA